MGNCNSGRWGGRPLVEDALTIDIAYLLRRGSVRDGLCGNGRLRWKFKDGRFLEAAYKFDMRYPETASLTLYFKGQAVATNAGGITQHIRLTYTRPNYGGRRWWMLCPETGQRVRMLHRPRGGERFACRDAWRLGYRSQRLSHYDRPFARLFRFQYRLGSPQGWGYEPKRIKGMWYRTYERALERYRELDDACGTEVLMFMQRLGVPIWSMGNKAGH